MSASTKPGWRSVSDELCPTGHLSFVLLGFVALCAPARHRTLATVVAAGAGGGEFIPVNELPLAAYVQFYTDDLAINLVVLLAWVGLCRLGVVQPLRRPIRCRCCCCLAC